MTSRPVALVGTVGVPARYGGFETLAEQLCVNLSADDVKLIVYCEKRTYGPTEREPAFHGHTRIFLPLRANGPGSLFYDGLALLHAVFIVRARDIYVFGYSGAWLLPLLRLLSPRSRFIVNVDGMEWRRDKFSRSAKLLLKALEYCAARCASVVIADNEALATLFRDRYGREPVTIAYGGDHTLMSSGEAAAPKRHYLAIARIEPENNTREILEGCRQAGVPLVFVGNWSANDYGRTLRQRFGETSGFQLLDPIYEQIALDPWRRQARGYIHGHSVGGTNPSLVEALFHTDLLISFDCAFNRATLSDAGHYFSDAASLAALLQRPLAPVESRAVNALRDRYRWKHIIAEYRSLLAD
ncbi:DUF1972 domain-containing protein [Brevundimonas sp.]|uniref:DUF1972 domain-containing protein n=1 Tax=Brevundimonas sp. TaxID=1871086 RepID=UPI002BC6EF9B|nr:DUF1972 domain-containing protein [Brevundimonas sp.]HWQ88270.1 DUF1972 domain-containing protein [Brevundimonas sp.]